MADYKNCTCIACRNQFEPDDDIVVCPDCGTPYHRDCWNDHGKCINTSLHESGESWKNPNDNKTEEASETVSCEGCGAENKKGSSFCTHCGRPLSEGNNSAFGGFNTDSWQQTINDAFTVNENEDMEGVTLKDVSSYVGKNQMYYLPRFRFFRDAKRKISPNLACIFFPQLWLAYRKMWLWAMLLIVGTFLLSVPGTLIAMASQIDVLIANLQQQMASFGQEMFQPIQQQLLSFSETVKANYTTLYWADSICSYVSLAVKILMFLFGNYIYYRHTIKKVKAVRSDNRSLIDVDSRIRMAGGTNIGFIFLALLAEFVLSSIMAYLIVFI